MRSFVADPELPANVDSFLNIGWVGLFGLFEKSMLYITTVRFSVPLCPFPLRVISFPALFTPKHVTEHSLVEFPTQQGRQL